MERYLKPDKFEADPNEPTCSKQWKYWLKTFESFMAKIASNEKEITSEDKLNLLINHVSQSVFDFISESTTYEEAIDILNKIFIKPTSEIFARYQLASRKQQLGESISKYLLTLKILSKECKFTAVTADEHKNNFIRDVFLSGILSSSIRQRLLENNTLTLEQASSQALALEAAQNQSACYSNTDTVLNASTSDNVLPENLDSQISAVSSYKYKCYFCGYKQHPRTICPAKDAKCNICSKSGHFSKVCKSNPKKGYDKTTNSITTNHNLVAIMTAAFPSCLKQAVLKVKIDLFEDEALIHTGSSESFLSDSFVYRNKIKLYPGTSKVSMASTSLSTHIFGYCTVNVKILEHSYLKVKMAVLKDLCADAIIGHDLLRHHSEIQLQFGGKRSPLTVCSLAHAKIEPPPLFSNLTENVRPIATKSRRHSVSDSIFIQNEVEKLLSDGIIEESRSPWRAQALVTINENHKRRMVIDYSQTVNRFTLLDAYPLPNIEDVVSKVSKYSVFSTIDLSSAYHQIPIREDEKKYTAFEAKGRLYQFTRIPFGVTNGVACFQRVIDDIIQSEKLNGTFAYLDDITVCGKDQQEHDVNLRNFLNAVKKFDLTVNTEKSKYSIKSIKLLGYEICNKTIRPDQSRLKPLMDLPLPTDTASLRRTIGMLAHYSKWVTNYSDKVRSLVQTKTFPLSSQATEDFNNLKHEIVKTTVSAIDENVSFDVETDASEHSIAATLSQNGRPVAFFSRTLTTSERKHSAIEKEAYAIVEALKKWRHYLIGRHFRLITDQKSVSFMFDSTHSSKIKNEKILRWRLELACYNYDIIYRPGKQNEVADTLSRVCGLVETNKLYQLHNQLCHPGITRMAHWVRSRNLPYSLEDIRKMTASCPTCAEIKPRFYKPQENTLIKATAPFERLNMDFKGPLPSNSKNKYLLTIVDEFHAFLSLIHALT